jgi:type I restriction enzyme R subunit
VNPGDKFELLFKNVLEKLFADRMDQNEDIFVRFMNDLPFQKVVTAWMADEAYQRLRSDPGTVPATEAAAPPLPAPGADVRVRWERSHPTMGTYRK